MGVALGARHQQGAAQRAQHGLAAAQRARRVLLAQPGVQVGGGRLGPDLSGWGGWACGWVGEVVGGVGCMGGGVGWGGVGWGGKRRRSLAQRKALQEARSRSEKLCRKLDPACVAAKNFAGN